MIVRAEEGQDDDPKTKMGDSNEEAVKDDDIDTEENHEDSSEEIVLEGLSAKWTELINKIHTPILFVLQGITQMAALNPKRTLCGVTALSLFLVVVGLLTNFSVDVDEDRLWTPANSLPIKHQDWIDDVSGFPADTLDFVMFFHNDGGDVLGQEQVSKVFEAFDAVLALPNYNTMCANSSYISTSTNQTTCAIDGIVNFWGLDSTTFHNEILSDDEAIAAMSARNFPDGTKVSQNGVFGKAERDDATDLLTFCQGYTVVIKFPDTDAAESFEDDALDLIKSMREEWDRDPNNPLRLEVTADGSFSDEFERAIVEDIPLIPIVFIIMSVFTALVFFKRDKVQSRSLLGFGAVVAVLLSLLSGYGLLFIIGIAFTSMTQILPFVIFGIGLDDAFIIYGSYSRTDPALEPEERILETIDDVGISITLTSITSSLAFGLGCLSSIPAVYWLCLYAFPKVIFIYLYQITFFIAWIVLDERRIKHNKRDCCVCVSVNEMESEEGEAEEGEEEQGDSHGRSVFDDFMIMYAKFLMKPLVKVVVVLAFIALAVLCAISASELKQQFEFTEVMPDNSYVTDFFHATEDYAVRNSVNPLAYFRHVDQSNSSIQEQMESYVNALVAMDAVEEQPEYFWLRDFKIFIQDESVSGLSFNEQVDLFLSDPVNFDLYGTNIVRDEQGTITASRVRLHFENVDEEDVKEQIDTLKEQRDITARQPINVGLTDYSFFNYDNNYNIWEFFRVTPEEFRLTTIMGVVAVTGVALVFIPHWTAALFVLPMICLLYLDLLGVMQWAGVYVNAVTYISVVMSIGLLVDFIMHVLLRYYECAGNREEKTIEMLRTMGSSILVGGISTFLGTLPLAFSTSTIFFTIFIAFVGLVTLGVSHGLILLPVILSTIGPEDEIPRPHSRGRFAQHEKEDEVNSDDMRMTERTLQQTERS